MSVRAEARAERRAAAIVEARMRSDRWRWRAAIGVGVAGLVYLGFVVGLVVGARGDLMDRAEVRSEGR